MNEQEVLRQKEASIHRFGQHLGEYQTAVTAHDQAMRDMEKATHACDAADEALIAAETQLAKQLDEMKALARLHARIKQAGKLGRL